MGPAADRQVGVAATDGARGLLLGGRPFESAVSMWWNFVARSHDEIDEAAAVPMRTPEAEALAAPRRAVMREFAGRLRAEVQEFAAP